jgi:hypothetical protein
MKKFYQTINQAPRSAKNYGKHRRASPQAHGSPAVGTGYSAGGAGTAWTPVAWNTNTVTISRADWSWSSIDMALPEPEPPTVPYAGIRTGELIGHRLWWLVDGQLCSLAHRRLWQPGETIHGGIREIVDRNIWGTWQVWGGTYSFFDAAGYADEVEHMLTNVKQFARMKAEGAMWMGTNWIAYQETATFVAGTIRMWGEVIEHERGYRAEFAKLNSIDVIYGDGDLEALRTRYGVRS